MATTIQTTIRTVTADAVGPVVFSGKDAPSPALFNDVETVTGLNKPIGGLWTTRVGDPTWIDWCRAEQWDQGCDGHSLHTLGIAPGSPLVAVIDSEADFDAVLDRYGYRTSYGEFIDFEAMAWDGYWAVWLTDRGQWATRMRHRSNLYGWDLASVLWLHWAW